MKNRPDKSNISDAACWIDRLRREGTILMRCEEAAFPWLLYETPRRIITTDDVCDVMPSLREIEAAVAAGNEVCGYLAYEAAPAMDEVMDVCPPTPSGPASPSSSSSPSSPSMPLLWFGIYDKVEKLRVLPEIFGADCFVGTWNSSRTDEAYGRDFTKIKNYIASGETYQINYTIRLDAAFCGSPYALFYRLYQRQPTVYATYLSLGDQAICSVTPELFFEKHGVTIVSKPMKGTRPADGDDSSRQASRAALAASEKDRAENAMIVDMIRNDFGRVARRGSVTTPSLFDIEEHPTVWQMTSTVRCESDASLAEILAATFPCASITGAPKIRSMKIIRELENAPRGVYTGTLGRMAGDDARFSVAIRTATVDLARNRVSYGCGGGIVWDSRVAEELDECHTKANVITQESSDFELLETMLYRRRGYFLLARHLDRLAASARFFGFSFDRAACERRLQELAVELQGKRSRVRLLLDRDGQIRLEIAGQALAANEGEKRRPWRLVLAAEPVDSSNPFLYHKTTRRDVYRHAIERAKQAETTPFDDVLLFNERGNVTESTIANLVVRIGEHFYTPSLDSGLLGGTFRQALIERSAIREKRLMISDVLRADALFLINSVRGLFRAVF